MVTIEERAKEYADNYVVGDYAMIVDLLHKVAEESYLNGATEQRQMDIDKALDAHCEYCDHTCPHNGMECYIRENIRKAMEE